MLRRLTALGLLAFSLASLGALAFAPNFSEATTVSAGTATRAAPTLSTEGMALGGVRGFRVSICAASGQTLNGTGTLRLSVYNPRAALWMQNYSARRTVDLSASRCQTWYDYSATAVSAPGYRVLAWPDAVAVSGGANVTVYIDSCLAQGC